MYDIASGEMNNGKPLGEGVGPAWDLQNRIIAAVAKFYKISIKEMKRRTRKASVAVPRQVAIYLLREMAGLSSPAIGRLFGLDHSTAIHAHQKIQRKCSIDARLDNDIQKITDSIRRA